MITSNDVRKALGNHILYDYIKRKRDGTVEVSRALWPDDSQQQQQEKFLRDMQFAFPAHHVTLRTHDFCGGTDIIATIFI